jgi:hypothetical protein
VNSAPLPKTFASVGSDLGAPKRFFEVKKAYRAGSLAAFFCLLTGSVLVFLKGLSITIQAYQKHGPAMIEDVLAAPGMAAFLLFLAGLAAGWWAYSNWGKGVAVYEQGLAVLDRKGLRLWRWGEIVSMTAAVSRPFVGGISTGMTHSYRLINRQNQRLIFGDVTDHVDELARLIQAAIFPGLYERAGRQYNAGEQLVFGPVTIGKGGIQIGNKAFAWVEVQQVSIRQGLLKVSKKEAEWFGAASAPASRIPNLEVLLNIIQQVVGLKTG